MELRGLTVITLQYLFFDSPESSVSNKIVLHKLFVLSKQVFLHGFVEYFNKTSLRSCNDVSFQ